MSLYFTVQAVLYDREGGWVWHIRLVCVCVLRMGAMRTALNLTIFFFFLPFATTENTLSISPTLVPGPPPVVPGMILRLGAQRERKRGERERERETRLSLA